VASTDTSFFVESLRATSVSSASFSVSWTAPRSSQSVSGYRIWLVVARDHNGYDAARNTSLAFAIELRPPMLTSRATVSSSTLAYTFTGCYQSSNSAEWCLKPWTLYEVYVAPFNLARDGTPIPLVVSTREALSPAPTNVTVVWVPSQSRSLLNVSDCENLVKYQPIVECPVLDRHH
jgi:hypothetical protein